jgi:hypothetical protein
VSNASAPDRWRGAVSARTQKSAIAEPEPIACGQVWLTCSETVGGPIRPGEASARIGKDQLKTLKLVAPIEPSAPSEMGRIFLRRHRKQHRRNIFENVVLWFTDGEVFSRLEPAIHVPKRIVCDLSAEREHDQFRKPELQPNAGRVAESRSIAVGSLHTCRTSHACGRFRRSSVRAYRVAQDRHPELYALPCWLESSGRLDLLPH